VAVLRETHYFVLLRAKPYYFPNMIKILSFILILTVAETAMAQNIPDLNQTDQMGRKQGTWVKTYPNGNIMYEGFFVDDHPSGEFKRYYDDKKIKALLTYSEDGKEAQVVNYYPNGNIAAKGTYINQKKEGKWQFYSASSENHLISDEYYSDNIRNGTSVRFYPNGTIAEKVIYTNDIKNGEWIKYHLNGSVSLRSAYANGKINGKFEVWYEDGMIEFSGQYKNDLRDGLWLIYNSDGSLRYRIKYKDGVTNDRQMDIDMSNYLDSLDNNKESIAAPEKTGNMW
jgi:antitoxin component YwqK of YwqJK toxin-antitoxin module